MHIMPISVMGGDMFVCFGDYRGGWGVGVGMFEVGWMEVYGVEVRVGVGMGWCRCRFEKGRE
jgi:hypothetical protein